MDQGQPYIPPNMPADENGLLARYTPPLPRGIVDTWLKSNLAPGSWVLDPFGASPIAVLEAARAGFRVLVTANNPISRHLIEILAISPPQSEAIAALAAIAATRKGDERLETHIRGLYVTECSECYQQIEAEAFIWEQKQLIGRIFSCPSCGAHGEFPPDAADFDRIRRFQNSKLHRARAIERVAPIHDQDRPRVEKALEIYSSRQLYAIMTLLNKLEGLSLSSREFLITSALILHASDAGNSFWPYPVRSYRPRQYSPAPQHLEKNVWFALEHLTKHWPISGDPIPITIWPQTTPEPGSITLFEGRIRDLSKIIKAKNLSFSAGIAIVPRLNPVFWTLSALWSGWLWGSTAINSFRSVLHRQRYDWSWHSEALYSVFHSLDSLLDTATSIFGLICEPEANFLTSSILAATTARHKLVSMCHQQSDQLVQLLFKSSVIDHTPPLLDVTRMSHVASSAAEKFIRQRSEPAPFIPLQTVAIMESLTHPAEDMNRMPINLSFEELSTFYKHLHDTLENSFSHRHGWLRYGGTEKSPTSSLWWHRDITNLMTDPLADRVEKTIVNYLQKNPVVTQEKVLNLIYQTYPALFTPDHRLVLAILNSYASCDEQGNQIFWHLNPNDTSKSRQDDLENICQLLIILGEQTGYRVARLEQVVTWSQIHQQVDFYFYPLVSTVFGKRTLNSLPERSVFVLPGSRAALAVYKLEHNPFLDQIIKQGWRFLKFRHLRHMVANTLIDRSNFPDYLEQDPIATDDPQLRLI